MNSNFEISRVDSIKKAFGYTVRINVWSFTAYTIRFARFSNVAASIAGHLSMDYISLSVEDTIFIGVFYYLVSLYKLYFQRLLKRYDEESSRLLDSRQRGFGDPSTLEEIRRMCCQM